MVALSTPTLSPGYTIRRPIRMMTAAARATLSILEVAWIAREWANFEGAEEDSDLNVIMERITPSGTRVWVMDRDGEDGIVMLMLPEDY